MDWKDMLSQLKEDLPQVEDSDSGTDSEADHSDTDSPQEEPIHVVVEKKGRKGKTATIAEGFLCSDAELEEIASTLKRKLGVGGSARGGEILIQGECRDRLAGLLREMGYKIK